MQKKPKIIVVLGATSTGKSDFAVEIAKAIGGEIISADSRQVYKGMDIGTGKITKREMRGVPHHLLDVANPKKTFTVSDYQKKTTLAIAKIVQKNKIPIICGGTGFYIDAVVNGIVLPEVPPNKKLREELYRLNPMGLVRYLEKLDPVRAKTIDKDNPVRLIRAIEIATALGRVPSLASDGINPKYEVLKIGLTLPDEILKEKIRIRLLARMRGGMLQEVRNLHKSGISWKRLENLGLEYRYCAMHLQNKINKTDMIEKLNTEIWHYTKRQRTWFKRDTNTIWINPQKIKEQNQALKKIKEFLK